MTDSVTTDALNSELALFLRKPARLGGVVGEKEKAKDGHQGSDGAFDDEEPSNVLSVYALP